MAFEKIQPSTGAMSLMACAVNHTAKYWVAFITHPDSKNLKLCLLQHQAFLYPSTQQVILLPQTGITNLQKT